MTSGKIKHRQLMALVFLSLLSPIVRTVPDSSVIFGGRSVWLSPIVAAVPIFALYAFIQSSFKKSKGGGLADIILKTFGGIFGRVILIIFIVWLGLYTGFVLRTVSERLLSSVYTDGRDWMFSLVLIATAALAASGQVKSLVRTAQVFVPIIAIVVIAIFLLLTADIKIENLLPITHKNIPDILLGSLHMINTATLFAFFTFMYGSVEHSGNKGGVGYIVGLVVFIAAMIFCTIGVLSAEIAKSLQSPFFIMIRNIEFFNVLERIEAVVIAFWVISDFLFLGSLLSINSEIMRVMVKGKKRTLWVWALGAAAFVISIYVSKSAFGLFNYSTYLVPVINLAFTIIVIPVIILTARIRKTI